MENIMYKPVIGVVMCRNRLKGHQTQTLQEKYLNAIVNHGGLPIALPYALAEPELLNALVDKLDGIYLPGSPSNVQPHLYGENGDEPDADPGRDLLSMALINAALERRIPIFAICRGLQELVVATGGTLYRRLFEQPELLEHREDPELPVEQQYAPSHQVEVQEGGLLSQLIPGCNTFWVNSLHGQGAKTLALDSDLIIADEPTGSLDLANSENVMTIFKDLRDAGKCIIIVSHDLTRIRLGSR